MPISYFLAAIISYLGLLLGIILIKFAPEEQRPGKKYFILFKKALLVLIIALLFYFLNINSIVLIALSLLLIYLLSNKRITLESTVLVYILFGIIFSLSSKFQDLFLIESVLIFLYGIPTASLILKIKKKNYSEIFVKNLWFFVPIMVLYFIL